MARLYSVFGNKSIYLQLPSDFLLGVTFDDVADFDVVEVLDVQAAIHTCADFLNIVLVTLQGTEQTRVNDDAISDDTNLGVTRDLAVQDHTTCDGADLADLEGLTDLEVASDHLLYVGGQHAFDSGLDFLDGGVNDGVETDINLLILRHLTRLRGRTHVETHDDGV